MEGTGTGTDVEAMIARSRAFRASSPPHAVALVDRFRAYLARKGLTQVEWLKRHGIPYKRQNLHRALIGTWKGPGAQKIIAFVQKELDQDWIEVLTSQLVEVVNDQGKPVNTLSLYQAAEDVANAAIQRWSTKE